MAELTDHLVDKRVQDRNMRRGALDKKDFEKHIQGLKDVADNAEVVQLPTLAELASDEETDGE